MTRRRRWDEPGRKGGWALRRGWPGVALAVSIGGGNAADTGVGLSYLHDTNTSRSISGERLSDDVVALRVFREQPLTARADGVRGRIGGTVSAQRNYSDLSYIALNGGVDGRVAEWGAQSGGLDLYAVGEVRQYAGSDIRDGLLLSGGARAVQSLDGGATLAVEGGLDHRTAWSGDVFDLRNRRLQVDLDKRFSAVFSAYVGASFVSGQDVFTVVSATAGGRGQGAGRSATDPAFGNSGRTYTAYRSDATARIFDVGARVFVGGTGELDLRLSRYSADGQSGLGYEGTTFRVGYVQRFR